MQENVIEVKSLVKKYGNFTAVNDLSFNVGKGEVSSSSGRTARAKPRPWR